MMLKFKWSINDLAFLLAVAIRISSLFADYNFECIGNYGAMCSIWIHELYLIFKGMTNCCSIIFAMTSVSVFFPLFFFNAILFICLKVVCKFASTWIHELYLHIKRRIELLVGLAEAQTLDCCTKD